MPTLSTWFAPKPIAWGSWITIGGKTPPPFAPPRRPSLHPTAQEGPADSQRVEGFVEDEA